MSKRVILVTGTPCVGKTSAAQLIASRLNALYVNLTELATSENLILGRDRQRKSIIVDEHRMKRKISQILKKTDKADVIVDGHYAVNVVPEKLIGKVFVLRRDPVELRQFMKRCGFSDRKMFENLASEILDVCLVDALNVAGERKVCELNTTGKSVGDTVHEMLFLLKHPDRCCVGVVDWLGKLESEGLLEEYFRI